MEVTDYKADYKKTLENVSTLANNVTEKEKLETELAKALETQKLTADAYDEYVHGETAQGLLDAKELAKLEVSKLQQKKIIHKEHVLGLVY